MRTALRLILDTPLARYDADARAYIQRVERADGQALETGVRQAIDTFVRGCKADGIWEAIKASCVLAGARTLAGALVPLKGTAPTNFNFVSGDYNRKTGLVGDGSTKYLNSNRANNADPQNNQHLAAHATTFGTGALVTQLTASDVNGSSHIGQTAVRSRNITAAGSASQVGFNGVSRGSSGSYVQRVGGASSTVTQASQSPANDTLSLWRTGSGYGTHRLAFYSIGESLDLALLDARVTTLVNSIATAIDGVTDPDARTYINAVENADGQALEVGVAQAYSTFITGCKSDGIWEAIKASCILAGARTLSGALVPLKGTAPTNFNFVSGDYNRKTGLAGNSTSKYLNSNRSHVDDPQNNTHISVFAQSSTTGDRGLIHARNSLTNTTGIVERTTGDYEFSLRSNTTAILGGSKASVPQFLGVSRSDSANISRRSGASTTTTASTSVTHASAVSILVFAVNSAGTPSNFTSSRLSYYSIGESLNLALLDARVTTLVNTLNSVIP